MRSTLVSRVLSDPLDFALFLSCLVPVVLVSNNPRRAILGALFAVIGLASRRARHSAWYWLAQTTIAAILLILEWRWADDHLALAAYWYLAIALTVRLSRPLEALQLSAKALIGLTFVFAVAWKLRSPDFANATFFEFTLLTDPRFAPVAELAGVEPVDLAFNRSVLLTGPEASELVSTENVEWVARALTVGTIVVEPAVAIAWLWPGKAIRMARHLTLAVFCLMTYTIVPVVGFGFLLLTMGSSEAITVGGRRAYLIGATALFLWGAIWNALVLR